MTSPEVRRPQHLSSRSNFRFSHVDAECSVCQEAFEVNELRVLVDGQNFHTKCFRCAQCFELLQENSFYNFEDRFYCKHDFFMLYAPICQRCDKIIEGKVKCALNASFHPHCFTCMSCKNDLTDSVWYVGGEMICTPCKMSKARNPEYRCKRCTFVIEEHELLRKDFNYYHASHFNCFSCKQYLNKDARSLDGELYCMRCYDLRSLICADCKKPIDKEKERSVMAMDKHFHVYHFRCYHCGRPFMGTEFFEKNKKAYCKNDYLKLFADFCFVCSIPIRGNVVRNFGKCWCVQCYRCMICWKLLKHSEKVASNDGQPMCKKCLKSKNYQKVVILKMKELKLEEKANA